MRQPFENREYRSAYRTILVACCLCVCIFVWSGYSSSTIVDDDWSIEENVVDDTSNNISGPLCNGWCSNKYLTTGECTHTGIDRLRTAFQVENCAAALQRPENLEMVNQKIEKIANDTPFTFFRGAAALFDFNMMCDEPGFTSRKIDVPHVYSNGDCHPENFGVMMQANSELVWGVNDFDQTFQTPFSWDLRRGATGFALACQVRAWANEDISMSSRRFIDGYMNVIMNSSCKVKNQDRFIEGSNFVTHNASLIGKLFAKSRDTEDPKNVLKWLEKKMSIDIVKDVFVESENVKPLPESAIPEFQASVDAYLYHGLAALAKYPNDGNFYQVLSVARKLSSGTGSVGLDRYWLLIKGRYAEKNGFIILEMKQEVNSVLEVFFRYKYSSSQEGKRAVDAMRSIYPYANLFYGWTTYRGSSFIIRERSKHSIGTDVYRISKESLLEYASHAGRALAFSHIRARCPNFQCRIEDDSAVDTEMCENIVNYLNKYGPERFADKIHTFSIEETLRQVEAWNLLRNFVNSRLENKTFTDILRGGQRPKVCMNLTASLR